jgi:hypothetical protein
MNAFGDNFEFYEAHFEYNRLNDAQMRLFFLFGNCLSIEES